MRMIWAYDAMESQGLLLLMALNSYLLCSKTKVLDNVT